VHFLESAKYQPIAQQVYELLAARIRVAIPDAQIEHIGSSAVDGLISKGDLDIFVGVFPQVFETSVQTLESLGFRVKEGSLRTESLCPFEAFGYSIDVGIQLVALNSEFEFFLVFRDCLKSDLTLRQEYNKLKLESKALSPDEYRQRKSEFIELFLSGQPSGYRRQLKD
jgi:GrpB-like predicted nucleotidyltransferase (UPF0157 family)